MLNGVIPAVRWIAAYKRSDARGDLMAGALVAVMLVPQAMAYAMLAGLPPVVGLYASTFPLLAYAFLGTSRQLAVGPVAMVSLLVAAACSEMAEPGSAEYLRIVATLAVMVGAMQLLLGLVRAGFLVNFVSHAVVSGFTSAGAVIIGLSQVQHLLGIAVAPGRGHLAVAAELSSRLESTHWPSLALGGGALAVLLAARRLVPRFPAALAVVAGGTVLVRLLRLDQHGLMIVGAVPRGLPGLSAPAADWSTWAGLFPAALVILFVGYMESVAVAQWVGSRLGYRVDANSELAGLGAANLAAGLLSGYPVTGGFSRTAVNYQAGARTPLASVISALLVLATLLVLTPLFTYVPKAVLAAIILAAVAGLIDVREPLRLFRIKAVDGWTLVATFLATLLIGIDQGILTGVLLSLVLFVARSSRPHTAVLGYVAEAQGYHDVERYPGAETDPGIIILRVDASLYFANARFVEDRIRAELAARPVARWVVLEMSGVNDIDAVAVSTLESLMAVCAERGVRFAFAGMKARVRDIVGRADWERAVGPVAHYADLEHALSGLRG